SWIIFSQHESSAGRSTTPRGLPARGPRSAPSSDFAYDRLLSTQTGLLYANRLRSLGMISAYLIFSRHPMTDTYRLKPQSLKSPQTRKLNGLRHAALPLARVNNNEFIKVVCFGSRAQAGTF